MSAHELFLTERAREDFEDIIAYTTKQWRHDQANEYAARIDAALINLCRFPELGRNRNDLSPGVRSIPMGQHIIYYHPTRDTIVIRRIVHSRRDIHIDLHE